MEGARDSGAHGGHRARLRQRVRSEGFEGLEPHELIEFLLFYAVPRRDVNELAHRLVERFGSARGVLLAAPEELTRVPGVGAKTAKWLSLVGEAAGACAHLSAEDRPQLRNCLDAFRFAMRVERELSAPCCVQLCLDGAGRLLYRKTVCRSLSWGESGALREALRDMLVTQARCSLLLLFGAWADGPAGYDVESAASYAHTLRAADCELLDVVLVCGDRLFSMRRAGQIPGEGEAAALRALREDYLAGMPEGAILARDFREPD